MTWAKQKLVAAMGVLALLMVYAAGCDYDHDHYRDYGRYPYGSYSRYSSRNDDGWRDRDDDRGYGYWHYGHDRDHDWDGDSD